MIASAQIDRILDRYSEIEARMASDHGAVLTKLAKEYSHLDPDVRAVAGDELVEKRAAEIERMRLISNAPTWPFQKENLP